MNTRCCSIGPHRVDRCCYSNRAAREHLGTGVSTAASGLKLVVDRNNSLEMKTRGPHDLGRNKDLDPPLPSENTIISFRLLLVSFSYY